MDHTGSFQFHKRNDVVKRRRKINIHVDQQKKNRRSKCNLTRQVKQKRSLGALRKANKTKPKSPDLTGQMKLQRHTAAAIVDQFSHDGIEEVVCNIAGWKNQDYNGPYLSG